MTTDGGGILMDSGKERGRQSVRGNDRPWRMVLRPENLEPQIRIETGLGKILG